MASKYLDKDGLTQLWTTIKTAINQLVRQQSSLSSTVASLNSSVSTVRSIVSSHHNYDQHYVAYSDDNTDWVVAYGGIELYLGLMLGYLHEQGSIDDSTEKIFACLHNIGQPELVVCLPDDNGSTYPLGDIGCLLAMEYFKRNPQYFLIETDIDVNITLRSEQGVIPIRTADGEAPTISLTGGQTLELRIFLVGVDGNVHEGRVNGDAPDGSNSISPGNVTMTQTYYVTYTIYPA